MSTLDEILKKMEQAEDDLIEMTDDDIAELLGDLHGKVDSIRAVLNRMESTEERLARDIKLLTDKKRATEAGIKRFKEWITGTMAHYGFKKLPGEQYDMRLTTKKRFIRSREATEADYYEHPAVVRRKLEYSFDHKKLEAAYKGDPKRWSDFIQEGKTQFVTFPVHK